MAVISIPGYTAKTGPGGIPIYTPKKKPATPIPGYTGRVDAGGIEIYNRNPPPPITGYTGEWGPSGPSGGALPVYTRNMVDGGGGGGGTTGAVDKPAPAPKKEGYWNIPDYDALLAGDWEPANAAIRGKEMTDTARAQFSKAFKQAFIDWGGDPSKLTNEFRPYIDDPTIEAAKANKFSAMAQNLAAMTKSLRNQDAQRTARGSAMGGGSVGDARRGLEDKERADYGDFRTFLGVGEEGLTGISKADRDAADLIAEARSRAAGRIATTNPRTWEPGDEGQQTEDGTAATPEWAGISWGGHSGIKTKAALQAALGYGQNINTWAKNHKAAWDKLT